jgi:chromosome segregation ATPase
MQAAATAERQRVERELTRLNVREVQLAAELEAVQSARAELEHQREVLEHFATGPAKSPGRAVRRLRALPDAPPSPAPAGATVLRGARIREAAVRVLAANTRPDAPVHYRDWYELLTAQDFLPAGKDPLATFLTQIGRSPVVRRTTTAGMYVLDLDAPTTIRTRLARLAAELADVQEVPPNATVEEIASTRERRARLTSELEETERQLDEALRSLGESENATGPRMPRPA